MHRKFAVLTIAAVLVSATSAAAERRLFILANNPDGYGVDRCLATGASCGAAIASAYCRAREFNQAISYRKVEKDDVTGTIPADTSGGCNNGCDAFVAIECTR